MKKFLAFFLIFGFIFTSLNVPAFGAVKAGVPCKSIGLTSSFSGQSFICIKSGKKLIWSKLAISRETPTPTPTPTPTLLFTPWSTGINQDILLKQAKLEFSKWALTGHGTVIIPNYLVDPKLEGFDTSWIQDSLNLATRAFGVDSPSKYDVVIGKDCQWIRSAGSAPCNDSANNQYYSDSISKGFFVMQAVSVKNQLRPSDLQTASHEYFHAVQAKLSNGADWPSRVPPWFIEGGAYFVGISFSDLADISSYLLGRNEEVLQRNYQGKKYVPLEQYTYQNFNPQGEDPYGIGCVATEFIVASIGMDKYLDIYRSLGAGRDFKSSFEIATGIPLQDFYTKFELVRDNVGMPHGL